MSDVGIKKRVYLGLSGQYGVCVERSKKVIRTI